MTARGQDPADFAWRVHSAQEAWTAKVDVKASILMAAQMGLLVAGAAAYLSDPMQAACSNWIYLYAAGMLVLLVGAGFAAAAIYPSLKTHPGDSVDLIYFGHLRSKSEDEIVEALDNLGEGGEVRALARQLQAMACLNWAKHLKLRVSIWCTAVAVPIFVLGLILTI